MEEIIRRHGTWRVYTPVDGLADMRVEHIAEDAAGDLWFATITNGVSRFDGETFHAFTHKDGLVSNTICCIVADLAGQVWLGGFGGVVRYDGDQFHRYEDWIRDEDCIIQHLAVDRDGRVWMAGQSRRSGLARIAYCAGNRLFDLSQRFAEDCPAGYRYNRCWGIAPDDEGRVWFGVGALVCYDGHRFVHYSSLHGLPDSVWAVSQPAAGGPLWVGGMDTLGRFDGRVYTPVKTGMEGYVRKIQADRDGRIWVCTTQAGVLCYEENQCQTFTSADGLPYPYVDAVQVDREGHIWFATWGGGVGRYDPLSVEKIGAEEGLPDAAISALTVDVDGRIWAGFGSIEGPEAQAVASWEGGEVRLWDREQGLDTVDCMALHEHSSGDLFIGDWLGLVRYDGRVFQRLGSECGFDGERVYSLAEDDEGVLYIGHGDAAMLYLSTYDGTRSKRILELERQGNTYISAILKKDGDLWFGVGGLGGQISHRGVGQYDLASGRLVFHSTGAGLPDSRIEDLCQDGDGGLWIATIGGLVSFADGVVRTFTTAEGLPNNYIQCLCLDRQGYLWIGTQAGVSRYDGAVFQTVHSAAIGSTHKIVAGAEGGMWFATHGGLVGYRAQTFPPRMRIVQVIADEVYTRTDRVEFPSSAQQVVFEYKALSSRTLPQHMLYTCRLLGHEEDWRPATPSMRAFYRGLGEGEYRFEVKAIDRDFNESATVQMQVKVTTDPYTVGLAAALNAEAGGDFVGVSTSLRQVENQLAQVAPTQETVLVLGETGTGKGLAARAVHRLSPRRNGPFIQVNCGAIPRDLVESELFGHERGAFTGAVSRKLGKVELARDGTLFLDEIGDMPLEAQVKLLQLLEEQTFMRVGGQEVFPTKVRVVAATNRNLRQMADQGHFREDLYFRLHVFEVRLPPLRQRREDILLLASYFAARMAAHLGKEIQGLTAAAERLLLAYGWPGNVRELEHVIKRAVIVCPGTQIRAEDLTLETEATPADQAEEWVGLEEYERRYICQVLQHTGGVIRGKAGAATLLGLNPSTLYSRMKKLGIARA